MKAYILKHNSPISNLYARHCADTCDAVGLDWEYFEGWSNCTGRMAWCETGIQMKYYEPMLEIDQPTPAQKANVCSAGHGAIWKKIADGPDNIGIVLEHDAIVFHNIDESLIPEMTIVALGYKMAEPSRYDHVAAGPPTQILKIVGHEGAHAYAMTKKTAQYLISEIEEKGTMGAVDNAYFIPGQRKTKVPLAIASPTPAMGYLRESTIWDQSAQCNHEFIESFKKYYK
jgi:hypothetical protein